jgi:hypothetical protein
VPVCWFHGTDLDATAFAIADNRTAEFAQWNDPELVKLLEQLRKEDALDGVGYTEDDLDALVQQLRDQEEDNDLADNGPDEPPLVAIAASTVRALPGPALTHQPHRRRPVVRDVGRHHHQVPGHGRVAARRVVARRRVGGCGDGRFVAARAR